MLHGSFSYLLQDAWGQIAEAHSISAGLDYPGVGPEHVLAQGLGPRALRGGHRRRGAGRLPRASPSSRASSRRSRAPTPSPTCCAGQLTPATAPSPSATGRFTIDGEADAFDPAGTRFAAGDLVIVNLSGRGDKDVHEAGACSRSWRERRKLPPRRRAGDAHPAAPTAGRGAVARRASQARLAPRLARASRPARRARR